MGLRAGRPRTEVAMMAPTKNVKRILVVIVFWQLI